MSWHSPLRVCALLVAATVALGAQQAQQAKVGAITGTVSDPSGGVIPGASVSANSATGTQKAVTNSSGRYRLEGLQPGSYRIDITLAGFRRSTADAAVQAGRDAECDVVLRMGISLPGLYVIPADGLAGAMRQADAVVHFRITQVLGSRLLGAEQTVLTVEHIATIAEILKGAAPDLADGKDVHIWQMDAGQWIEDGRTFTGHNRIRAAGDEFVGLFYRDKDGRLVEYSGGLFMFPVVDGKVLVSRARAEQSAGIESGMPVGAFVAALRKIIAG